MTCSIVGCEKPSRARTWCVAHWRRWRIHGDPNVCMTNLHVSQEARFWQKVQKGPDCWTWTGSLTTGGYGSMLAKGKAISAHRFAYELLIGPIPEGMHIDHRCSNRKCVSPAHLRAVTRKQNMEHLTGARRHSITGVRGVSPRRGKFVAQVGHNNETLYLGQFETLEEAEAVVIAKRNELFTHNDADRKSA